MISTKAIEQKLADDGLELLISIRALTSTVIRFQKQNDELERKMKEPHRWGLA